MPKQIAFREPIGTAFHTAVLAHQKSKKCTYEEAAAALLREGLELVRNRGIIGTDDRKSLIVG